MGDADFDFGDCDCGDCDCGDCDCGDCDCDCDCKDCACDIDNCCGGCICNFDECSNCQACCGSNGDEKCGRECISNDFDCCRCSCCDFMCCVFYDDIYYYGYYGNNQPYYGHGGNAHGRQQNTNHSNYRRNQQRQAYANNKPPAPSSHHNSRKQLWFRRFVKCLLPCGKPFWRILFILLPLYILFSPILVPVLLIYTCIRGCRYCMGLEPDRNAMTAGQNAMNPDPGIGPPSQTMGRGMPGDYCEEQERNSYMMHPMPPYQGAQSSVIIGSHGTYTAEEVGPQMIHVPSPDPLVPNKDRQLPAFGTENGQEPNVDPPPYPGLGPGDSQFADPLKTVQRNPEPLVLPAPGKDQLVPAIGAENEGEPNIDPPPYPGLGPGGSQCAEPTKTVSHDK